MSDPRSVMKEFRSLEQKRAASGLTPAEEARYARLRDLVVPDAGGSSPGFDVDAAAARLRESLLPAGLRNRPPPTPVPAPPEPEPAEEPSPAEALASAYAAEPFQPVEAAPQDSLFDPASLSPEAQDAAAAAYDPNAQGYDPGAQPYDPNAQPYDPNAQHDASQGYDPNAQAGWDPNAAWDPNSPEASQQGWDPAAQPYDPNAQSYDAGAAAYDPNAQGYDPGAQPYDPSARPYDAGALQDASQPYDPNAQPYDAGAQYADATPGQGWEAAPTEGAYDADAPGQPAPADYDPNLSPDAGGQAYPPADAAAPQEAEAGLLAEPGSGGGFDADPNAAPVEGWAEPSPEGAASEAAAEGTPGEEGVTLESLLPFDAAAAAAIGPGEMPEGFGGATGEYDDTAGFEGTYSEAAPADLPPEEPEFQAAQTVEPAASEGWQADDTVLEDGFQLESGGSFDAAAGELAPLDGSGSGSLAPAPAVPAPDVPEMTLGDDDFSVEVEDARDAGSAGAARLEIPAPDPAESAPPEEEAAFVDAGAGLAEGDAADAAPQATFEVGAPPEGELPPIEFVAEAHPEAQAAADAAAAEIEPPAPEDDIPTIDGEEILEEIPAEEVEAAAEPAAVPARPAPVAAIAPPAPAPALAPPPPPEEISAAPAAEPVAGWHVPGAHRVVVHTLEGQVKRGVLEDVDLDAGSLGLAPQPGAEPEVLPSDKVKAIFFMLSPGEKAPPPEGKKVRVTFRDGRQVAGFSPDYREGGVGFFMIPVDTRTNTGRIWVYRSAVRQVSVS